MPLDRIMVIGPPGSGKSTLARALGERLGLPVFHLDQLYHRPGWQEPPKEAFAAEVARVASQARWVIDGNYSSTAAPRLRVADAIVYLDVPRWRRMLRVLRRSLTQLGRQRPDTAPGCPERIDIAFLLYVWRWDRDTAPRVRAMMDGFAGRIVMLRSSDDLVRFLQTLPRKGTQPPLTAP